MLKKTVLLTKLDKIALELKNKKANPQISIIGKVKGRGVNDFVPQREEFKTYSLRRLQHHDYVILEQFVQVKDKELDDYIISKKFKKGEEPPNWKYKIIK